MNREDIIRMAREAFKVEFIVESDKPRLERFAELVAEAAREECAKVAETFEPIEKQHYVTYASDAIRTRRKE